MPQGQLSQVLREVGVAERHDLLVGPQTMDDAGVVRLGSAGAEGMCLVQTVDYFPPVVDDPYLYGAVAAANSLSDVYAMGGQPLSALNLAGFPPGFSDEWMMEIFRGGFDKVREAGAVLAGGHTVRSQEPQFGFSVTGLVHENDVIDNEGAKAGDVLYLTKPLGMGPITAANRKGVLSAEDLALAGKVMATLNRDAAKAMVAAGAHAATDITGFGLVGHSFNIAKASDVTLRFDTQALPLFPGALELAKQGVLSGGCARGRDAVGEHVATASDVNASLADILFDAETSGGLLISIPESAEARLQDELAKLDVMVERVGHVTPAGSHRIHLD
ncbi:MAG: selenide, water dikinase SelD [Planctomycetota bacterium]|nr:selenide, water dikinase SelD [Planctomycetota bacterium]